MSGGLSYGQALDALEEALRFGMDPSLEPIRALCSELGEPQRHFACVQVAGTNGKTSVSRMVAALLRGQGMRVGLYTSPHLVSYPERMEIDGVVVGEDLFAAAISAVLDAAERIGSEPTEFELLTAAALWLFDREKVDFAVLECGLGGRWDATSVVDPCVAVITGIGLDHTAVLGGTIEQIAREKAAIIKPASTAVLASNLAAEEVFLQRAAEVGVPVCRAVDSFVDLIMSAADALPAYQRPNIATALVAAEAALGRDIDAVDARSALVALRIPGRFEVLRETPLLIVDAAHNPQSAQVLALEVEHRFEAHKPTLLLGVLADKDARGIVEALASHFSRIVVTASGSERSLEPEALAGIVCEVTGRMPQIASSIPDALRLLADVPVLATGSITVAGEVKGVWC